MIAWLDSHTLFLCAIGSIIFSGCVLWQFRERTGWKLWLILLLSVLQAIFAYVLAKAFAGLEAWEAPQNVGFSMFGCVLGLPLYDWLVAKVTRTDVRDVFDLFTICLIGSLGITRLNCLHAGCCYGAFLPWLFGLRWPVREIEILFQVAMVIFFVHLTKGRHIRGGNYPLYMMLYGLFRFVVEWFRANEPVIGVLHFGHIWALVSLVIGAGIYFEYQAQSEKEKRSARR